MKTRPLIVAALTGVAVLVSAAFAPLTARAMSAGKILSVRACPRGVAPAAMLAAKALTLVFACRAKS